MLSCWLSLKRVMKKEVVWSRLQLFDGNLSSKCGWQNLSGYPLCSARQLRGMALAGRNAPGSSCVCSRAPAAYSETHVAMAPLAASSSVRFLGVCGLIAVQPCSLQTWERVVQLGLTEDTVAAVPIMQCHCWLWVCVCILCSYCLLKYCLMLHMELFLQSTVKYFTLLPNLLQKFICCLWSFK